MVTITDKSRGNRLRRLYEENGATVNFVTLGEGTATSRTLDTFGLDRVEKAVIHTIVDNENFASIKRVLERKFRIDVPGTGIVFIVPLSSMGGKRQLSFLLGDQEFAKSEETTLKNTSHEMIIIIANQGYTEDIMDAARAAGAGGGTVIHAKGTGMQAAEKFLGITIAEEKEMIYIVTRTEIRDEIMKAVMEDAGIKSKAQAVCFSLPVSATAGMRLIDMDDEEVDAV